MLPFTLSKISLRTRLPYFALLAFAKFNFPLQQKVVFFLRSLSPTACCLLPTSYLLTESLCYGVVASSHASDENGGWGYD